MSLHADTINLNAILLKHPDKVNSGAALSTRPLEVVIVIVQLSIRVGLGRLAEGKLDVLLAENLVEDGLAP